MAFPKHWYGDPSLVVDSPVWDLRELAEIRDKEGCKRCKHNDEAWETDVCLIGETPRPRYCKKWRIKETAN